MLRTRSECLVVLRGSRIQCPAPVWVVHNHLSLQFQGSDSFF